MSAFNKFVIPLCYLLCVSSAQNSAKDAIGFPEVEENTAIKNKENRQPVYIPATCPINELYYPGDQKDDWICDCRPAYLYHPDTDMCWPAYRQGPCQGGFHLTLPENSVIPICEKNPCSIDSYVMWNGNCEKMNIITPCTTSLSLHAPKVLGVNATTLKVECVPLDLSSRLQETVAKGSSGCAAGSKRNVGNKCNPV